MLKSKKTIAAAILVLGGGGAFAYTQLDKPAAATKYVLGQATKQTVVVAVSGSGQVSGQNQLDINPDVSGEITQVLVKPGDEVKQGDPLFQIDNTTAVRDVRDAQQSVRNAQLAEQSAELSYQKFVAPADALDVEKAQNAVNQAQRTLDDLKKGSDPLDIAQAQADLDTAKEDAEMSSDGVTPKVVRSAYDNAVPQLKTIAQDLADSLKDADQVLGIDDVSQNDTFESFLSVLDSNRLPLAQASYGAARDQIKNLKTLTDALSPTGEDEAKVDAAVDAAEGALRVAEPMLQQTVDVLSASITSASFSQSSLDSMKSRLQSDHSSAVSQLTTVNNLRDGLDQAKTDYDNAVRDVAKKQAALDKLVQGTDPIDIADAQEKLDEAKATLDDLKKGPDQIDIDVQKNTVEQRKSDLQSAMDRLSDAQQTLADYTVRAPFEGVIVSVPVKAAQQASASTKLATLLTKAKMVTIPLNEVDIANVKVGQKATITFDALTDLSIAGTVTSVDPIGTVSQGVVTYNVEVAFLTDDDRVKPGMSADVSIATNVATNVLTVPNSAVKNGTVQILSDVKNPPAEAQTSGITDKAGPKSVPVQTGLADDSNTEITSGLNEGDWIIVRTVTPSATTASTATRGTTGGLLPTGGGGNATFRLQTGGGGNFRGGGG